jgi:LPXTG-motif cell wall-anchored protein
MSVLSFGAARAAVIGVAAARALALLALPSAAHAAEVVTCTKQATAATQPWLTFSQSANFYAPFASASTTFIGTTLDLTSDLPASFTAEDLDAYEQGVIAAEEAMQTGATGGVPTALVTLGEEFQKIDPNNTTGWQEKGQALFGTFIAGATATGFESTFQAYVDDLDTFSTAASALVQADVPAGGPFARPAIPASLETNADAATVALQEVVALYQSAVLDGAAQLVVYEDVCVTTTVADTAPPASTSPAASAPTLASTGSSDGLVLGTASGLLLLVGAASLMLARRRSA